MRVGIRTVLSGIVLGCILISAGTVHGLWHRTAQSNSRGLVEALERQITAAVRHEVAARIADAQAAFGALRTILVQGVIDSREADKREFVFLSQIQAQPALSWVAFGWEDGGFFASHKLGDRRLEMMEIAAAAAGPRTRRIDRYKVFSDDIEFEERRFEPTAFDVREQEWFATALAAQDPAWFFVTSHPEARRAAVAYAGPVDVYGERQGVLAVMIDLNRLSRFLAGLAIGRTGAAFILGADGHIVAAPDPEADEVVRADPTRHPLYDVVRQVGERLVSGDPAAATPADLTVSSGGAEHGVTLAPLGFQDWRVAVVVPQEEFWGEVARTTRRLWLVIALFVAVAALLSLVAAQRLVAEPLRAVVGDLGHVETFMLDRIRRRPSRLSEFDALSAALVRVRGGLDAFGKYIPRDLVRTLLAEGVEARPGGSTRPLTVMFADVAGFTGLSERLKGDVVPLIGAYLDAMSRAIEAHGGTVDKFIGDAVMAFWGAPRPAPDHAAAACRAALACLEAVRAAGLVDDAGAPLRIRMGIDSGIALVGNIGSPARLNYTALGDVVNVASRLEGINKLYGTGILIGEETRRQAKDAIVARELDHITVYGREGVTTVYELVGTAGEVPAWVAAYEVGLESYRARRWTEAAVAFRRADDLRGGDPPSRLMIERCERLLAAPPAADWRPVTPMDAK